jgi:TPP-dependent pyruvate/acetoin dehydrogenase alpha subunit
MPGVLVDGNDVLALAHVTAEAAVRARRGEGPTLIEALTYRRGAHTSSDDPTAYRDPAELREWECRDPIRRFRAYLESKGCWDAAEERSFVQACEQEFAALVAEVEGLPRKAPLATLFDDVYADRPWHLEEQFVELDREVRRHRAQKLI